METPSRFDIAVQGDVAVESDLSPRDPSFVNPLLPGYPVVRHLNPKIGHGRQFVLT